jgi:hypothetical protein
VKIINISALLIATAALSACATRPENIAPAYVSGNIYQTYTCAQLGEEEGRLNVALAQATTAQRKARSSDTWGIILLGLPVSSLSGSNMAGEVGRLKGELQTVQQVTIKRWCPKQ